MKTITILIFTFVLLCSCRQQAMHKDITIDDSGGNQLGVELRGKNQGQDTEKKIGQELFKSIMDTIQSKVFTEDTLMNNQWVYRPFNKCESYLKFHENGKGISFNCEMEEEYEMTYRIEDNKLFIAEYNIPHVDNEENRKIKYRDDTYIFNGHSLLLVDSRMYNIDGLKWIPKIEVVIHYDRK